MEPHIYEEMARIEDGHWWFQARRRIVQAWLNDIALPHNADILEVGCGSGGNLALLSTYGNVYACEMHPTARDQARARGIGRVEAGHLPDALPFADQQFDLIVLCDVLEHVKDDAASLRALRARLKPGGYVLLTVPALPLLWSNHDIAHHHYRRYYYASLVRDLQQAGFTVLAANYMNVWLFPLVLSVRLFERIIRPKGEPTGMQIPPKFINELLYRVFSSERGVLKRMRMPFGVSLIAVGRA